ncbi:sensor domain-containing diguanylate cyclase [Sulfurisoma sediminicola]|uniref:diguanylate cyclase n=1 Tax=Sulfurisoma sediminicola TaxID=1381557 RepID=A0A497XDH2_9PROT|nr:diguanylate cyclase [Sulfurisoma sediminicola]RLJ65021.1 diguanylate cyclase (GGDEF)-like protein [Sulfurisoma sediminicola]
MSDSALISVLRSFRHLLIAIVLPWVASSAFADGPDAVSAVSPPAHPLGAHMTVLDESGSAMSLADVLRLVGTDGFTAAASTEVIGLGIGHRPIWTHLRVDNPSAQPVTRYLAIEPTWIDHLDVHIVNPGQGTTSWRTGDAVAGAPHLDDALGYLFEYRFPPGRSEVLIRAATNDPLVLDVRLLGPERAARAAAVERYTYGFFYGFLGALIIYNLVMYLTLGRRNSLSYSGYLVTFAVTNLAYTGRGLAWLWPDEAGFQRYVILALMVLAASTGLRFAREFLELDQRAPKLGRVLRWSARAALALMAAIILADFHEAAVWLAFVVMAVFVFTMLGLGIYAVRQRQNAAGYFLVAAIASMIGVGLTLFSVWGLIPFNTWTYRGMEVGMMLDATLLSLALAKFVRMQMLERQRAERDARIDPLTQIFNRRGFYEQAEAPCRVAIRHQRPLSLVLMDLDHFKAVNDRYGHAVGDLVLTDTGGVLAGSIRRGDIVARWGGEEFILLLPETDVNAAADFAERIRIAMGDLLISQGSVRLQVTASFGVGQLAAGQDLEGLINIVDTALYSAKVTGRNRVVRADRMSAGDGDAELQELNEVA